eukprot:3754722-Prymnesium_polylepis.2
MIGSIHSTRVDDPQRTRLWRSASDRIGNVSLAKAGERVERDNCAHGRDAGIRATGTGQPQFAPPIEERQQSALQAALDRWLGGRRLPCKSGKSWAKKLRRARSVETAHEQRCASEERRTVLDGTAQHGTRWCCADGFGVLSGVRLLFIAGKCSFSAHCRSDGRLDHRPCPSSHIFPSGVSPLVEHAARGTRSPREAHAEARQGHAEHRHSEQSESRVHPDEWTWVTLLFLLKKKKRRRRRVPEYGIAMARPCVSCYSYYPPL